MLPRFLLPRFLSNSHRGATDPLPRPDPAVCVVGDLHGRADLLEMMLARIAARRAQAGAEQTGATAARLILVGDLIDRGPDSAAVLTRVQGLVNSGQALALMGNHERMALDFLDAPDAAGPLWLANGGDATLASFGLNPHRPGDLAALAAAFRAALPAGQEDWLRRLPLIWREGGLAVSHAGADPRRAIGDQTERALLWGHRDFRRHTRTDGIWLVHGHVIEPVVRAQAGRIGTDTGAFATGRLSAAWLDGDGLEVIEVQRPSGFVRET